MTLEKTRWRWWLFGLIFLAGVVGVVERYRAVRESSQDAPILAAARRYQIDPALVKAVVWRESWFDPKAKGRKQEVGLMQIKEAAATEWAGSEHLSVFQHDQLFEPAKNTLAGTWYLGKLLRRYHQADNPLPYALADYNAGRTHVLRWATGSAATNSTAFMEQIGFPSTKEYVRAVLRRHQYYRRTWKAG